MEALDDETDTIFGKVRAPPGALGASALPQAWQGRTALMQPRAAQIVGKVKHMEGLQHGQRVSFQKRHIVGIRRAAPARSSQCRSSQSPARGGGRVGAALALCALAARKGRREENPGCTRPSSATRCRVGRYHDDDDSDDDYD